MWDRKDIITLLILTRLIVDSQTPIDFFAYKRHFTFKLPADTRLPAAIDHHPVTRLNERGQEIPTHRKVGMPTLDSIFRKIESDIPKLASVTTWILYLSSKCFKEDRDMFINVVDNFDMVSLSEMTSLSAGRLYFPHCVEMQELSATYRSFEYQTFQVLNVTVREVREAFNLTLLAVPVSFMKEPGKCHETVTETINKMEDIHQYMKTCEIFPADKEQWITFLYIFPGCYYVLMTNDKRESWQAKLGFFETSYRYLDRKILNVEPRFSASKSGADNMHLQTAIIIPQSCFEVTVKLYELKETSDVNNDRKAQLEKEVESGLILPSEECTLIQGGVKKGCDTFDKDKDFMFESTLLNKSVQLEWKGLTPGGGVYFYRTDINPSVCHWNDTNGSDLMSWRLLSEEVFYPLGYQNSTNDVDSDDVNMVYILLGLAVVVLSIASAAVIIYFIKKSCRNRKELKEKLRVDGLELLTHVIDEGKLKHILLVYARGHPQFMTEMRELRYRLKQECGCKVHDIYSSREFSTIAELGAHEWVTKLLIDGSKVVWVDTPELCSYFNDKQTQNASTDCRDAAIPFAIELATSLFQNPTSQYRCHFVVRVEGFEVEDGRDDDPLRVVSPHARYHIPGNFSRLCRDITTTSLTPKYKQNPEV